MPSASKKLVDQELSWQKTRDKESWYVLPWEGEEWVRLRIVKGSGTLAEARSGNQAWTFKRAGVFHPHVTVRRAGEEQNVAYFTPRWTGTGLLEWSDGRILRWHPTRSWGREWSWMTSDQEILMRYQGSSPAKCRTRFEFAIRTEKEPALLTALGHYLIQLMSNDAAMLTAVAAAAAAS